MLVSITWLEYLVIVLIVLGLYYIVIAVMFYRDETIYLINRKLKQKNNSGTKYNLQSDQAESYETFSSNEIENCEKPKFENRLDIDKYFEGDANQKRLTVQEAFEISPLSKISTKQYNTQEISTSDIGETDDILKQVEDLTIRLEEVIATAVHKKYIKEEFILALKLLLKEYYALKSSPFLLLVNNLINSQCEKYNFIRLSDEERLRLWD